jgi:hypothetical protein
MINWKNYEIHEIVNEKELNIKWIIEWDIFQKLSRFLLGWKFWDNWHNSITNVLLKVILKLRFSRKLIEKK